MRRNGGERGRASGRGRALCVLGWVWAAGGLAACESKADTSAGDAGAGTGADAQGLVREAVMAGCDHFDYGPDASITAGAAPTAHEHVHPHERTEVALPEAPDGAGRHLGYLHIHDEGAPEAYLLFSRAVPVQASDPADGRAIAPLGTGDATAGCAQAELVLHYALPAEGLHLKVGPTEVASLTLVSHVVGAPSDGHDHEREPTGTDAGPSTEGDAHVH